MDCIAHNVERATDGEINFPEETMKRRSFLQAVGGAIAAVFTPVVAAEQLKRVAVFPPPRLAMSWLNTEYGHSIPITPPETLAELRAAIESRYETVHEFKQTPYDKPFGYGIGRAPTAQPVGYNGPFYRGFVIAGEGVSEKEAVADALNGIDWNLWGGKEMMWRVIPHLNHLHSFEADRSRVWVRARVIVLR